MALINCAECRKEISSEAQACPQCGHPIATTFQNEFKKALVQQAVAQQQKKVGCGTFLLIAVAAFILLGVIGNLLDSGSSQSQSLQQTESYKAGYSVGKLDGAAARIGGNPIPSDEALNARAQRTIINTHFKEPNGREQWAKGYVDGVHNGYRR